jgi:hypothetical protein
MTEPSAYFPQELCDEIMPPDRPTREAWIEVLDDGTPAGLAALDIRQLWDEPPGECRHLADGDIVKFVSRTDYGVATLTLTDEGFMVSEPMPADAEQCCILDGLQAETLAGDVEECVGLLRDYGAEPDDYRISYYTFDDGLPYRFDAATRHFDQING